MYESLSDDHRQSFWSYDRNACLADDRGMVESTRFGVYHTDDGPRGNSGHSVMVGLAASAEIVKPPSPARRKNQQVENFIDTLIVGGYRF
jgi:hypothetical protein